jgi:Ca-activated chloride channel family protein
MSRSILVLLVLAGCSDDALYRGGTSWYGDTPSTGGDEPSDSGDAEGVCEDAHPDPVTVYMSADDSNSQARATLDRAAIEQGLDIHGTPRVWELLNYYDFDYPAADPGTLRIVPQMRAVEGDPGSYEMLVAVVAPTVDPDERRPLNLTFSVDTSGSMSGDPLELARETMLAIASELHEGDIVSMVSWDDDTRILLDSHVADGPDDPALVSAIRSLASGGSTNLSAGLIKAYQVAERNQSTGRTNRVVLISDGGANTGVTDEDLIARNADDAEGEGIYLIGVGVGDPGFYSDALMDTVTDLGKGAYLFVDSASEAARSFTGERLVSNLEVAARDVRLSMTLPPGFVITEFHGEQISTHEADVVPQHLAPNDAMLYHLVLADCGDARDGTERFDFSVDWEDARTGAPHTDVADASIAELTDAANTQVLKAHAIVAYGEAVSDVWDLPYADRRAYMDGVYQTVQAAYAARPDDRDLLEIIDLVDAYRGKF